MDLSFLPHLNASLNALACCCLLAGFAMIKAKRATAHRNCMITAAVVSCLFLVSYITHYTWRSMVIGGTHTPYHGSGPLRTAYYAMLLSHILLAMVVPFLAAALIYLAATSRFNAHRHLARIGLPIWLYVSTTGVLIYLMLYWLNPVP